MKINNLGSWIRVTFKIVGSYKLRIRCPVQLALMVHDAATCVTAYTETHNYVDDGTLTNFR